MPAHIISLEQHQRLVEAFRTQPGRFLPAAKAAGISPFTAKRYWLQGHPDAPDQRAKPISQLLDEERLAARARMVELEKQVDTLAVELEAKRRQEQSKLAQKDATDTRVQEAQMIRMARGAASGLLVTLTNLSKGAAQVGVRVAKNLNRIANDPADMSQDQLVEMVRTIGALTTALRQANDASRQAMEMERLLLGEPTAIIGHAHLTEVSVDEAERRIQAGLRALQRAKDRGLVVDGHIVPGPGGLSQGVQPEKPALAAGEGSTPEPVGQPGVPSVG